MRKMILFLFALSFVGLIHAQIFGSKERSNVLIQYTIADNAASTSTILIDRSDTTNYPHDYTTAIEISNLDISVDKVSTATGTVKVGVITGINASTANVSFFKIVAFDNSTETYLSEKGVIPPSVIRTQVKSGATPFLLTNDTSLTDSNFQNDTAIPTSAGSTAIPEVGDIVVQITRPGSGLVSFSLSVLYQGVAR